MRCWTSAVGDDAGTFCGGVVVADAREAAARGGLRAGDRIVGMNGVVPLDVLDVEDAAADGTLWLSVLREGHPLDLVVKPKSGEWHGISLDRGGLGDDPRTCRNRCRFCFVDQVPAGLRPGLSVKDDDYRLSFLHGNFMTLTNLSEADLERIEDLALSPLFVSLHAWDDAIRVRLMGRSAAGSRAISSGSPRADWNFTCRWSSVPGGTTALCWRRPCAAPALWRVWPTSGSYPCRWPPRATCGA